MSQDDADSLTSEEKAKLTKILETIKGAVDTRDSDEMKAVL